MLPRWPRHCATGAACRSLVADTGCPGPGCAVWLLPWLLTRVLFPVRILALHGPRDPLNKSREPARHGTGCRTRRHLLSIAALLTANGNAVMRPLRGCDGRGDLFRGSLAAATILRRLACLCSTRQSHLMTPAERRSQPRRLSLLAGLSCSCLVHNRIDWIYYPDIKNRSITPSLQNP